MNGEQIIREYLEHLETFSPLEERTIYRKIRHARKLLKKLEGRLTKEEAEEYIESVKRQKSEYVYTREFIRFLEIRNLFSASGINSGVIPFSELLERYISRLASKELSQRTLDITRSLIRRFLEYLESRNITDITRADRKAMSDYALYLLTYKGFRGSGKVAKPYNVTTRVNIIVNIRNFFKFLCSENIILSDPSKQIEVPKLPKRLSRDVPTLKEIDLLIDCIRNHSRNKARDISIIETLYGSGIRVKELVNLNTSDIDFDKKIITVYKGKNRKDRAVPINTVALSYLREYIEEERPKFLGKNSNETALFLSTSFRRITADHVGDIIKRYSERAGIKKHLIPHSFRYACATHMLKNGADIRYIQELLGHKFLGTTERYTKVIKGDLKRMLRSFHPRDTMSQGEPESYSDSDALASREESGTAEGEPREVNHE